MDAVKFIEEHRRMYKVTKAPQSWCYVQEG